MRRSSVEPRAPILTSDLKSLDALVQVLGRLGIEAYAVDQLEYFAGAVTREGTVLAVLDSRGYDTMTIRDTVSLVSQHQLTVPIAVLMPSAEADLAEVLEGSGATATEEFPLTLAKAYRLLANLTRQRPVETSSGDGSDKEWSRQADLRELVFKRQGSLKIYIGAAPGVGKTYAMLSEAHEQVGSGVDAVVAWIDTHGRKDTAALLHGLEIYTPQVLSYRGVWLRELDLEGVLGRHPQMALVDELAHTNVPGSLNNKRYQDVQLLRLAGISVVSTLNVQHLESLNNIVARITGVTVRETVPDSVLEEATEVVLVDLSPESLQQRLKEGKIYAREKVEQSLANFFSTHNLTALRELVLRELADRVDERLEAVRADLGRADSPAGIQDRILVCVTPGASAAALVRRGARLASRLDADLLVLFVQTKTLSAKQETRLQECFRLAQTLEGIPFKVEAEEVWSAIAEFARANGITMILLGESHRSWWSSLFSRPLLDALLHETSNIDVVTVASEEETLEQ